uniref:Uncharacterized protein n=1 Tax=Setaria digitata TaxID=48799 RepID=A0A915PPT9_9BILA
MLFSIIRIINSDFCPEKPWKGGSVYATKAVKADGGKKKEENVSNIAESYGAHRQQTVNLFGGSKIFVDAMVELIIPEKYKRPPPPYELPRLYRTFTPDTWRDTYVLDALTLNPGSLSNFHKDCLACIGNCFTGIQFAITKLFIASSCLKFNNKMRMGKGEMDGELVTKYITTRQTRLGEHNILVEAVTNFMAPWPSISIAQTIDDFWYLSLAHSSQENVPKTEVELEHYGRIGTVAFKYTGWPSSKDITCSTSYLRSITRKFALGSQLTFRYSAQPPPNQRFSDITYYARYRGPGYSACLDLCKSSGYHFSFVQNVNKYLAYAVDVLGSANLKQLTSTVAVQTEVPKYGLTIHGHLVSDGTIGGIFKKQFMGDFPLRMTVSGFYNFFAGECGLGIGISV